jgi:hypothetical protein
MARLDTIGRNRKCHVPSGFEMFGLFIRIERRIDRCIAQQIRLWQCAIEDVAKLPSEPLGVTELRCPWLCCRRSRGGSAI